MKCIHFHSLFTPIKHSASGRTSQVYIDHLKLNHWFLNAYHIKFYISLYPYNSRAKELNHVKCRTRNMFGLVGDNQSQGGHPTFISFKYCLKHFKAHISIYLLQSKSTNWHIPIQTLLMRKNWISTLKQYRKNEVLCMYSIISFLHALILHQS